MTIFLSVLIDLVGTRISNADEKLTQMLLDRNLRTAPLTSAVGPSKGCV